MDAPSPAADAAMSLTRTLADQVMASLSRPSSRTPGTGDPGPSGSEAGDWVPALRFAAAGMTPEV